MTVLERKNPIEYRIREIIKKIDWLAQNCPETLVEYQGQDSNFQVEDFNSLLYEGDIEKLEELFKTGDYGFSLKLDNGVYYKKIEYKHTKRNTIGIILYECEGEDSCKVIDSLDPLQDWCGITDEKRLEYLELFEEKLNEIKTYYQDDKYPQAKLSDFCS